MLGVSWLQSSKKINFHISVFALGVTCTRFGPNIRLITLVWDTGKFGKFHSFDLFSHPFTSYLFLQKKSIMALGRNLS